MHNNHQVGASSSVESVSDHQITGENNRASNPYKILIVGDSHVVGAFGRQLDHRLREQKIDQHDFTQVEVQTYAVCGSHPGHWVKASKLMGCGNVFIDGQGKRNPIPGGHIPDFAALLATQKPQLVVVALVFIFPVVLPLLGLIMFGNRLLSGNRFSNDWAVVIAN